MPHNIISEEMTCESETLQKKLAVSSVCTLLLVAFKNSLSLPYFKLNVNFADALILFFF